MDATTIVSFVLLILEAYLFTGIIFGFPNLRVILENEGIWSCDGIEDFTTAGCPDQSKYSQVQGLLIIYRGVGVIQTDFSPIFIARFTPAVWVR